MSYDLSFLCRTCADTISRPQIAKYFQTRPRYKIGKEQYWYENADTGVYFSFEHLTENAEEESSHTIQNDGLIPISFSFNINYLRATFFALEADLELSAFINSFGLMVDDPQLSGMGRGEYTKEGFLRGWKAGNLLAYSSLIHSDMPNRQKEALPSEALERMWRWNLGRERLQVEMGPDRIFIPVINLLRQSDQPRSWTIWGDGIPQAIPEVDLLMLVRKEMAPKRFFKANQDFCLLPFSSISALLDLAVRRTGPLPYYTFEYEKRPTRVVEFFRSQRPCDRPSGLRWDEVLEIEPLSQAIADAANVNQ